VLHLERFVEYLTATMATTGSPVMPRDVFGLRDHLAGGLGPSAVTTTWHIRLGARVPAAERARTTTEEGGRRPAAP
jgi:hypothetical protein